MNLNDLITEFGTTQTYAKKTYVFLQGDEDQYLYFIQEGVLKAFYSDAEGKEYIKSFLFSGDNIASTQALNQGHCSFSLLCLKDTRLVKIPYQKVRLAAANNLTLANAIIELLMSFAMKKEQREYELLCLSAEQRYKKLLKAFPSISEQISQNNIARYLGITPVALSRIKHK